MECNCVSPAQLRLAPQARRIPAATAAIRRAWLFWEVAQPCRQGRQRGDAVSELTRILRWEPVCI